MSAQDSYDIHLRYNCLHSRDGHLRLASVNSRPLLIDSAAQYHCESMKRFVVLTIAPCLVLFVTAAVTAQAPKPASVNDVAPSAIPIALSAYQKYDFTPGETILFADDFTGTPVGESPQQWEQLQGHAVVNNIRGYRALFLTGGNPVTVNPRITKKHYLGPRFTIEFDTMMLSGTAPLQVFFQAGRHEASLAITPVEAVYNNGDGLSLSGPLPDPIVNQYYFNHWRHVAIAVKEKQLKVYVDQFPVLTVPDMHAQPETIHLGGVAGENNAIIFRQVRIASGEGLNLTGHKFTEAKIVTHGITFDVSTSLLRPESMGTLNQIKTVLDDDSSLKFEIDGYTDNGGDPAHSLILSQQRADIVRAQLAAMGIDPTRLIARGLGDTKPMAPNDTPTGKAINRRIEFIETK